MSELLDLAHHVWLRRPAPRVLVVGDLMLDYYVYGRIDRMCPEADIPIVRQTGGASRAGGAGNAAVNLKALGADVSVFGAIGDDEVGDQLRGALRSRGIDVVSPPAKDVVTTVKKRTYVDGELIGRTDIEFPLAPDAHLALVQTLQSRMRFDVDAILVSDYAKGVIDPNLLMVLKDTGLPIYADPKRPLSFYQGVRAVFPNAHEGRESCYDDYGEESPMDLVEAEEAYLGATNANPAMFDMLAVTLGRNGVLIAWLDGGKVASRIIEATKVTEADVCGAGDTFAAAFVRADLAGLSPLDAARFANVAAGASVELVGAQPPSWEAIELIAAWEDERCKS